MAYERNWSFSFSNFATSATALEFTQRQMFYLKAMLTGQLGGFVSGLWSMYSSCDSVAAGNGDLVDRWGMTFDATKIVQGTAAAVRSWYVLKSPTMNGVTFYMTVSFDQSSGANASALMSVTAPTGGTTTARPTSADEWAMGNAADLSWNAGGVTLISAVMSFHMCLSSTGDFIFFTGYGVGNPTFAACAIAPVGCHPSDQFPLWTLRYQSGGTNSAFVITATLGINSGPAARAGNNGAGFSMLPTMNNVGFFQLPDVLTNQMVTLPAWVLVNGVGPNNWHMRGRLPDIFVTASQLTTVRRVLRDGSGNITHFFAGHLAIPANAAPAL